MYATAFDWLTATPFGTPVLPEVNSRYAVSFPSTMGSDGSASLYDNCRAEMTRWADRSFAFRLPAGIGDDQGQRLVQTRKQRLQRSGALLSHHQGFTSGRLSMTSVLSSGNLGFSGT